MGQQFWVIHNNPQPGTPAFAAKTARDKAREVRKRGASTTTLEVTEVEEIAPSRVQPKKTSRSQRKSK